MASADHNLFYRRIQRFYTAWKEGDSQEFKKVDAVVVPLGQCETITYSKSTAFQTWLFDYEISDIIMVFCNQCMYFLATKKKIDFLRPIQDKPDGITNVPKVELLVRDKTDKNKANFDKIIEGIKQSRSGKTIGIFAKDTFPGDFFKEWSDQINSETHFEKVDLSFPIGYLMAVKDELELSNIQKACSATEALYSKYLSTELENIIDDEKKISHSKIASGLGKAIKDKKYTKNLEDIDTCYDPVIQSGGVYNLRFGVGSDNNNIHCGFITCCLGLRFGSYCSNIARTLMVDPTQEQQANYEFLLQVEEELINRLYDGVVLSDLHQKIVDYVKKERSDLVDKLTKTFGFATGIEFRDGTMVIGPKFNMKAKKDMTFVVAIGFQGLKNPAASDSKAKIYSLFLSDTVIVQEAGTPATLVTQARRKLAKTSILLKKDGDDEDDDNDDEESTNGNIVAETLRGGRRGQIIENKLRTDSQSNEERRRQHQRELSEQLNAAALARLAKKTGNKSEDKVKKTIISYKSIKEFPSREPEIRDLKIYVDKKNETVILPMFGVPVPYHISTIKNISQSIEGDYTYLRINFFHPGSTLEKGSVFPNPDAIFLKEVTYRSSNNKELGELRDSAPSANLSDSFMAIKIVQKKFKTREAEEKEKEGVVKQDSLVLTQHSKVSPKLKDLFIRPNIYTKRVSGSLEAHVNGFRFTSIKGDKVDIMYNNIKHAIYQPCDKEMIILLHFNLVNPIMINKKKHDDIQFYTEVGEITTDLGKRQHMHDRDDYAAEQAERDLRTKLKHAFKSFCDKVDQCTKGEVTFETPIRQLGFNGVPRKSNVLLQPTHSALVNLTDWPPFVITIGDVELVHCERVSFALKAFDMVFVYKDYTRKPDMITAVPTEKLDDVRNWLDQCDIKYTDGVQSLNWPKIMKVINDDTQGFLKQGGWKFLDDDKASDEEQEDEEDEDDDRYEPSDDDDDDDEEEDESDISEEESDISEEDDNSEAELGTSEESGKDWSELEEEAAKADRNHKEFEDEYTKKPQSAYSKHSNGSGKRKSYDDSRGSKKAKR